VIVPKAQVQEKKPKVKVEMEKCPECFKRFTVEELPLHMQNDHFMSMKMD
jgi:hypothetical protein